MIRLKFLMTRLNQIKLSMISALCSKDLLEKYEYLTGEDLGYRPSAQWRLLKLTFFEKVSLSSLHWVKLLRRDWIKMIKKKDFLRYKKILKTRLKAKIKDTQNQLKMKNNQPWLIKNLKKNRLYNIFGNFGKKFLKKLIKDEQEIDYDNLFFTWQC